jgi:hypothetical protein
MLTQRENPKSGKKEYCLVARKPPHRVLEWYGSRRPSAATVEHSEKRIEYYKHR